MSDRDQLGLFELEPADNRRGDATRTHVLMPNMGYACGGSILDTAGGFQVGITDWQAITCTECKQHGEQPLRDAMRARQERQA